MRSDRYLKKESRQIMYNLILTNRDYDRVNEK